MPHRAALGGSYASHQIGAERHHDPWPKQKQDFNDAEVNARRETSKRESKPNREAKKNGRTNNPTILEFLNHGACSGVRQKRRRPIRHSQKYRSRSKRNVARPVRPPQGSIVIKQLHRRAEQPEDRDACSQKSPQPVTARQVRSKSKRQRRKEQQHTNDVNGMHHENLPDNRRNASEVFFVMQFPRKEKIRGRNEDLYQTSQPQEQQQSVHVGLLSSVKLDLCIERQARFVFRVLSSLRDFWNRTAHRGTTPMHRDRAIPTPQRPHPPWHLAEPHQRPRPPNFARQSHRRVRSPKLPSIRKQKPYLAQKFFPRHSQQSPHARILQGRHRKSSAFQNRRQPSRSPRAKRALRIKKQPPLRVPPFSVRKFRCQRNHGSLLCVPSALSELCVSTLVFFRRSLPFCPAT